LNDIRDDVARDDVARALLARAVDERERAGRDAEARERDECEVVLLAGDISNSCSARDRDVVRAQAYTRRGTRCDERVRLPLAFCAIVDRTRRPAASAQL
jgi:hypothetical protein